MAPIQNDSNELRKIYNYIGTIEISVLKSLTPHIQDWMKKNIIDEDWHSIVVDELCLMLFKKQHDFIRFKMSWSPNVKTLC